MPAAIGMISALAARSDFGKVEGVEAVGLGFREGHNLASLVVGLVSLSFIIIAPFFKIVFLGYIFPGRK